MVIRPGAGEREMRHRRPNEPERRLHVDVEQPRQRRVGRFAGVVGTGRRQAGEFGAAGRRHRIRVAHSERQTVSSVCQGLRHRKSDAAVRSGHHGDFLRFGRHRTIRSCHVVCSPALMQATRRDEP